MGWDTQRWHFSVHDGNDGSGWPMLLIEGSDQTRTDIVVYGNQHCTNLKSFLNKMLGAISVAGIHEFGGIYPAHAAQHPRCWLYTKPHSHDFVETS
jgi:hypothetical protein